jgi:diguanylate cyclase (GGDEF)-like protein/PAS domain S-box-containing protein
LSDAHRREESVSGSPAECSIENIVNTGDDGAHLRDFETYREAIELSSLIPWTSDPEGSIVEFDRKWSHLTGSSSISSCGAWASCLHPDEFDRVKRSWSDSIRTGLKLDHEHRLRMQDGSYRWFRSRAAPRRAADGTILRWYGNSEDIEERKTTELRLRWLAHHDALTGLPNRFAFQSKLQQVLSGSTDTKKSFGLLVMDLDGFKQVNDQLGHDAGDALLVALASAIGAIAPGLARIGGDEFGCLVEGPEPVMAMKRMMHAITARMEQPLEFAGLTQACRLTLGGAFFPEHGEDAREMLKSADIALYEAKGCGGGQARMFESGMRKRLQKHSSMLSLARHALETDAVVPFYQPKVNLSNGGIEGFEALLRWDHARLGHQLPHSISAAFEHPQLSLAIGERMLAMVLADILEWQRCGLDFGRISINASSAEISSEDYAGKVLEKLARSGVAPSLIEVEVVENVFMGRSGDQVDRTLRSLSQAGVTIALDDFGTGFASLTHLRRFPVDVLKIDRSFISTLGDERADGAIANALVGMAQSLGIETVAEGIESEKQAACLRTFGCTHGQGFLFGKAIPAASVAELIRSRQTEPARVMEKTSQA